MCCLCGVDCVEDTLAEFVVLVECDLAAIDLGKDLREGRRVEVVCFCARDTANFACFARLRGAIVKRLYVDPSKWRELLRFLSFSEGPSGPDARAWMIDGGVMQFRWNVWRRPGTREALPSP